MNSSISVAAQSLTLIVNEALDFDSQFVEICVEVSGTVNFSIPFLVNLVVTGGTVTLGVDCDFGVIPPEGCPSSPFNMPPFPAMPGSAFPLPNSLTIHVASGPLPVISCGIVTIFEDGIFEGPEFIQVSINSTQPFEVPIVEPVTSTLTITDSEGIKLP